MRLGNLLDRAEEGLIALLLTVMRVPDYLEDWLLTMLVFLVIVIYWPPLLIWLPKMLGMM